MPGSVPFRSKEFDSKILKYFWNPSLRIQINIPAIQFETDVFLSNRATAAQTTTTVNKEEKLEIAQKTQY